MATLSLFVGEDQLLVLPSGVGFYGPGGFDGPISIGSFNDRTFVTNTAGDIQGFEGNNNKYFAGPGWGTAPAAVSGVIHGQLGSGIALISLPDRLATINARFEHTTAVQVQNPKFIVFDGSNIENDPSGITVFTAEIRHNSDVQDPIGLGDTVWQDTKGSTVLDLISSPGTLGKRPSGPATSDFRHDWYISVSVQPATPNDKVFGFSVTLEFS